MSDIRGSGEVDTNGQIGTPMTSNGSDLGSDRRAVGTGSIFWNRRYWISRIYLAGGKRVARRSFDRASAEVALRDLLTEYADQVGYAYQSYPKRSRPNEGPRPPRPSMSARVRFSVLTRDGYRCVYCGATPEDDRLQVDHRIPVAKGGTDDPDNLVTACRTCNLGKADR